MRTAIYARHSTDRQATSTEDQIRRCNNYCKSKNYTVIDVYFDEAVSGSHIENRPGINALLMAAFDNRFDRVIAEDLSRISRDQADTANFFKKTAFVGVDIETVAEGEINELHIGLKSTMNALYLKDLSDKTHRGMVAAVLRGGVPGGNTYGYEIIRDVDEKGELIRGKRRIAEAEAEIVRRIFQMYRNGNTLRHICMILDREGIPSPSGRKWGQTTLCGTRTRKTGLLRNTLYGGIVTFNRMKYRKHPDTGKYVAVVRPEDEWIRVPVPELRIVDDETFGAVQKMLDERSSKAAEIKLNAQVRAPEKREQIAKERIRDWRQRQIKTQGRVYALFAGRLRCGNHDTKMGATWGNRYSCKISRCQNRAVPYDDLIKLALDVASRLTVDDIKGYYASDKTLSKHHTINERITMSEERLEGMRKRAEHVINALGAGDKSPELHAWFEDNAEQMRKVRVEIGDLKRELRKLSPPPRPDRIIERYNKQIGRLKTWSRDPEAVSQLRHVLNKFTITAQYDELKNELVRMCHIEYDFEALIKAFGSGR